MSETHVHKWDDNGNCEHCPKNRFVGDVSKDTSFDHVYDLTVRITQLEEALERIKGIALGGPGKDSLLLHHIAVEARAVLADSADAGYPTDASGYPTRSSATATAYSADAPEGPWKVCLCGSTRFHGAFQQANYEETMKGHIVLSVGFYPHSQTQVHGQEIGCTDEQKAALDVLHLRKIDLADEILVLNVGGYVGESTAREIVYAEEIGKPVRWLEHVNRLDAQQKEQDG